MGGSQTQPSQKKWTFLRKFRWGVYLLFIAFMLFVTVCLAVGIVSNLSWRYRDLDLPSERPESLSDLGSLELRDCLTALRRLQGELVLHLHAALSGTDQRDASLRSWKTWSTDWRERFEKLGLSCRLTDYSYKEHPTLGLLAEIYRLVDYFQRTYSRVVTRFTLENAQPLLKMSELFDLAQQKIEQLEGRPVGGTQ